MRLAFIGAGGIATDYLESLDVIDGADVVAVCDLVEERAEEAAAPRDADVFTDHRELYDRADFDAVVVCIPPFAHTDQELLAVEHGVDLFVAKPVALTAEKAAEVEAAVEDSDVITQAGYMWRYADVVERAAELLDGREIGMIDGQVWVGVPPASWWGEGDRSGGQIVEQATHIYDLVRYFGGDVERVYAEGDHRLDADVDFEDVVSATMRHEDGTVAHVSNTCGAPDGRFDVHLFAEDARLHLRCIDNELSGVIDGEEVRYGGERDGYTRQLEAFLAACRERDPSLVRSDYGDATETLRTTLAATRSLRTNEPETVE
jgi:predicted dehydrogenase